MENVPKKSRVSRINDQQLNNFLLSYLETDPRILMRITPNEKINMVIDYSIDLIRELEILKQKLPKTQEINL